MSQVLVYIAFPYRGGYFTLLQHIEAHHQPSLGGMSPDFGSLKDVVRHEFIFIYIVDIEQVSRKGTSLPHTYSVAPEAIIHRN